MARRIDALLFAGGFTLLLAACGGGGGSGGGSVTPGSGPTSTPAPSPTGVAANTIGIALPTGPIGTVNSATYGTVGGYTQMTYSQTLAFAPGTTVTIKNLSTTNAHTLNVLSTSAFPASPTLSTAASGTTSLDANYASGSIAPGGSVTVTLSNPGTYYIGCAYHYMDSPSMRDVLLVSANATPGPQATVAPSATAPPGGGGYGY
jgi:plastocyanin